MFDRIILLSDGFMIYSGTPKGCIEYFKKFGVIMSTYSNPADKLAQIAASCKTIISEDLEFFDLVDECNKTQK